MAIATTLTRKGKTMKVNYREVCKLLGRDGIDFYVTMLRDSVNQIVARESASMPFSTWFTVSDDEKIEMTEDDWAMLQWSANK